MPRKIKNLIGLSFGRLTVTNVAPRDTQNKLRWELVCTCGNIIITRGASLQNGHTRSCGCLGAENLLLRTTHNKSKTPEWKAWKNMKARCNNPDDARFKGYGGRGISMCKRWDIFENFYADMGGKPSTKHSLDRINNNGNYTRQNCRWATSREQSDNTRVSRHYTHNGVTKNLTEWCRELGIPRTTMFNRLERGMSFEEAIK